MKNETYVEKISWVHKKVQFSMRWDMAATSIEALRRIIRMQKTLGYNWKLASELQRLECAISLQMKEHMKIKDNMEDTVVEVPKNPIHKTIRNRIASKMRRLAHLIENPNDVVAKKRKWGEPVK